MQFSQGVSSAESQNTSSTFVVIRSSESSLTSLSDGGDTNGDSGGNQDEDDDGDGDNDDGVTGNQDDDDNGDGDNDDGIAGNNTSSSASSVPTIVAAEASESASALSLRLVAAAGVCGDGNLDVGEECDDNNRRDNDGCNSSCLLEIGICGDGIVQSLLGEQCESSSHDPSLPYSCSRCQFVSLTCGNGTVDPGEECDEGPGNSTSPDANCRPNCRLGYCGDGIVDTGEECDDGNRLNGDSCDRQCKTGTQSGVQVAVGAQASSSAPVEIGFNTSAPSYVGAQQQQLQNWPYGIPFPYQPSTQGAQYQLPLAQLQPLIQGTAPVGDTGPAAVAVIGAGAAAGLSWMRRKK